jgi:hypothetical protein
MWTVTLELDMREPAPTLGAVRVSRQRAKGWRMPEDAVYVGRPGRWGNGYRVGDYDLGIGRLLTVQDAVECYRREVAGWNHDYRMQWLGPLCDKRLACWCPEECGEPAAPNAWLYGDLYEPCAKPRGHDGPHDPSVPLWCHADVLIELLEARGW